MKIDNAILSVDDNPLYQRFWPLTSELWHLMGIKPKLYWVTDSQEKNFPFPSPYGIVEKIPILHMGIQKSEGGESNDSFFCSMWARMYGCAVTPGINMGTDLDIFPLDKKYFVDNLAEYSDTQIVHLSYEIGYSPHSSHLPPYCYYAARNDIYTEMMLLKSKSMRNQVTWGLEFAQDMIDTTSYDPERRYNDEAYMLQKVRDYGIAHQENLRALVLITRFRQRFRVKDLEDESTWSVLMGVCPDAHFSFSESKPFDFLQIEKFHAAVKGHFRENR